MKRPHLWILLTFIVFTAGCAGPRAPLSLRAYSGRAPLLTVVYPRPAPPDTVLAPTDSIIYETATDSVFLLGHVLDPHGRLIVNNTAVKIHPDGGWLAWVPRGPVHTVTDTAAFGGPGSYSTVTFHYETGSYKHIPMREATRTIYFVDQTLPGPVTDETTVRADRARLVVTSPLAKIRCGWPGTYDMFPPVGTILAADSSVGVNDKAWHVRLGDEDAGWIEDKYVSVDKLRSPPGLITVSKAVCEVDGRVTRIVVPLDVKLPFRIERVDKHRLELILYGAVSTTDLIVQPSGSRVVDEVRWEQMTPATYRLVAYVRDEWFWGWDTGFDDEGNLVWTVYQAPGFGKNPLQDLTIVLDPGHGGDNYSAIGPTGLPEKTANLWLARAVQDILDREGANVVLTRMEDDTLPLADRIVMAEDYRADVLISLHHNALPQGENPAGHHGASVHYYHRQAKPLAESIYDALTEKGWPGDGIRYQDLALARPTFCPAVLVEAGFMMHPEEEAAFRDAGHRRETAERLVDGLKQYLMNLRRRQLAGRLAVQ